MGDTAALSDVLYPKIEPFKSEMLAVSDLHTIYVEQSGKPDGVPVIFLHGGPGAGCSAYHRQFFDPEHYRTVLLDQRGCGRSLPFAELKENTTWDLVADIERIREHLGIDGWFVFGGSWGSTLGLAYAQTHPDRCKGLVLRGIFTLQQKELDWLYKEGASRYFPEMWEEHFLPHVKGVNPDERVAAYYELLTSEDDKVRIPAAKGWSLWEAYGATLEPDPGMVAEWGGSDFAQAVARIECHYFHNKGWFKSDRQLLDDVVKMKHIPGVIVQGRYDGLCPPETAWELHKAWPGSKLEIAPVAGHGANEVPIAQRLRQAMDQFRG